MKINQSSFLLFLLPAISAVLADTTYNDNIDSRVSRETAGNNARLVDSDIVASNVAKGAPDVPVDGKDGRPHAGPWVETNADRDRKGVTGSDDIDPVAIKYDTKIPSSEHLSTEEGKMIPHSNGGVMDDPHRAGPKEGTRGTEGGVSEKGKEGQLTSEKVPGGPKEAPPLPHSETKKLGSDSDDTATGSGSRSAEGPGGLGMLGKPADLPEKPHDIPYPKPPAVVKDDPLGLGHDSVASGSSSSSSSSSSSHGHHHHHHDHDSDPLHSLVFSFTMILVSEIGDKTFLVAALMAMRHPRLVVFSAAFSALIMMTVLSAVLGHAVPTLIPKTFTKFMAAILFLIFGVKMLKEGREMSPDEGVGEEMREVEAELEEKEHEQLRMNRRRSSVTPHNLEAGRAGGRPKTRGSGNRLPSPPESLSSSSSRGSSPQPRQRLNDAFSGLSNLFSLLLSPAWVQTFVMTFLGEWGDRSQIATIAMAAGQDYWWVTIGASAGHGICTAAAVIGGRAIAGRVSMRVVTLGGAVAFLVFGVIYFIEAIF